MPLSNSVIRRYTPPTCTLEILAQGSPLSRWMGKSVLKGLRFELRFDDPRLPEDARITIAGESEQLEALCTAVTNYVQELLQKDTQQFWQVYAQPEDSSKVPDYSSGKNVNDSLSTQTYNSFSSIQASPFPIYIQPSSHLIHNLFLGSLANPASGPVIKLTLLQLFDLACALDEYSADVIALPTEIRATPPRALPTWAPAAAVLVLALGLTPFTWQYANRFRVGQSTAKNTTQQKIALNPSSTDNLPTPLPSLTPLSGLNSQALPPNSQPSPAAGTLQISPNPSLPTAASPGTKLSISQTTAQALQSFKGNKLPNTQPGNGITIGTNPTNSTIPGIGNSPYSFKNDLSSPALSASELRNQARFTKTDSVYSLKQSHQAPPGTYLNPKSLKYTSPNFDPRLLEAAKNPPAQLGSNQATLFDTPQVAEARKYLKQRWHPPAGLKSRLEYSLVVGVDGSIEQILPLGKAARDNFDHAGIPRIGEPFVSPNANGQNVRIRAVLAPNGTVQTFPETK